MTHTNLEKYKINSMKNMKLHGNYVNYLLGIYSVGIYSVGIYWVYTQYVMC